MDLNTIKSIELTTKFCKKYIPKKKAVIQFTSIGYFSLIRDQKKMQPVIVIAERLSSREKLKPRVA